MQSVALEPTLQPVIYVRQAKAQDAYISYDRLWVRQGTYGTRIEHMFLLCSITTSVRKVIRVGRVVKPGCMGLAPKEGLLRRSEPS